MPVKATKKHGYNDGMMYNIYIKMEIRLKKTKKTQTQILVSDTERNHDLCLLMRKLHWAPLQSL